MQRFQHEQSWEARPGVVTVGDCRILGQLAKVGRAIAPSTVGAQLDREHTRRFGPPLEALKNGLAGGAVRSAWSHYP